MKNMFSISIFMFAFSIFTSVPVEAAVSCKLAHGKPRPHWQTHSSKSRDPMPHEIDLEKIKKQGFRIKKGMLIDREGHELGELKVLDVKYLYEWASKEFHEAWIKTGGIDNAYMKRILDINGQAAGKGFYVSLHPTDSAGYGPSMTVFPVKGPLVSVATWGEGRFFSRDLLERLGKAGIDYVDSVGATWIPIISARHLQNPKRFEDTLLKDWQKNPPKKDDIVYMYYQLKPYKRQKYLSLFAQFLKPEDR